MQESKNRGFEREDSPQAKATRKGLRRPKCAASLTCNGNRQESVSAMPTNRLLYTRQEAARQLSISVRAVDYYIAAKELDTRRIGRRVLVTHASLVRFASGNHFEAIRSTAARSAASSRCA
jgi:hypothetical protein